MKQLVHVRARRGAWMMAIVSSVFASMTFVSGCESESTTYCVTRCTCEGCSQVERADCLDDVDDDQRLAEHDGCATEFSDYLACYTNEGSCESGAWVPSTCTGYANALRACSLRSALFIPSACAEEKNKRQACGLSGGGIDPCTGVDECVAFCSLSATCDDLAAPQPNSTYVKCVDSCNNSSSSGGSSGGP